MQTSLNRIIFCICTALALFLFAACNTNPQTASTEGDFPLDIGNRWVYAGEFYSGDATEILTATYTLTNTIVDIVHSEVAGLDLYQVAHEKMMDSCPEAWLSQPDNWCERNSIPLTYYSWYAMDGQTLYQLNQLEAFRLSDMAWKQLVFPLNVGDKWYVIPAMEERYPNFEVDSSLRKVTAQSDVQVPAGTFQDCYQMQETTGGNTTHNSYCPGVGFVKLADIHSGTPFGMVEVLIAYQLAD